MGFGHDFTNLCGSGTDLQSLFPEAMRLATHGVKHASLAGSQAFEDPILVKMMDWRAKPTNPKPESKP